MNINDFYYRGTDQRDNVATFMDVLSEFPEIEIRRPSMASPWHWQADVGSGETKVVLNFWPHRLKVQRGSEKARIGAEDIRDSIKSALIDSDPLTAPRVTLVE